MSNALALAAVSAVLKDLLNNGLIDHDIGSAVGGPVTVTVLPPDRIKIGDDEQPQLNLFLHRVTPNTGWQNARLPSRDDRGDRVRNPALALDLHYLLTAYGKSDFDCEILLGYAMQLLHETPVLPRSAIRSALGLGMGGQPVTGAILPTRVGPLSASDLAEQVEQIKIAPQNLATEELSKLWTALQAHYRPSAAYHISVVLIESSKPTREAKPVSKRSLFVLPFRRPVIESVSPQMIVPGAPLTLRGFNFSAPLTKLNFGTSLVDPSAMTDLEIKVTPPADLRPGVNSVQVVQQLDFGTPTEPHRGFDSNLAPFILAPKITAPASVSAGNTLTVGVTPPVGRTQRAALLLGDRSLSIPSRSASGPDTTATLDFPIPADFPQATYPIRLQVDGAQSLLDIETDPNNPNFGQYTSGPTIAVTA